MAALAPPPSSFVFTVLLSPPPPASSSSSGTSDLIIGVIVIVVVIVLAAISVGLCCYLWGRKKRRQATLALQGHVGDSDDLPLRHWQQQPLPVAKPVAASFTGSNVSSTGNGERPRRSPGNSLGPSNSIFTYEELEAATNGFSDANLLGQGGFGYVHKGVLSNGVEVAIKQLKSESRQGEREFQAEVEIISRIHHRNLVVLLGYCISGSARMLVYEFIPNNTMEFHLHGNGRPVMSWATRLRIAVGSARGLAYLHEDCRPKIIHRDIKAANILLNNRFEAKVADFGLAKFTSDAETHVSTRVMGTFGYLAPEYAASGRLTAKSDVYSFGVILLELITGRIPFHLVEDKTMVNWAKPLLAQALEDGNFDRIADPRLQNNYNSDEMARMVACAASCIRESARHRPRMSLIVRALEGSVPSNEMNEPGVYTAFYSYGSSDSDSQDNEDMYTESQNMASGSQGHTTGEHNLFTGSSSELQQRVSGGQQKQLVGSTAVQTLHPSRGQRA